jgi:hypothetical protein
MDQTRKGNGKFVPSFVPTLDTGKWDVMVQFNAQREKQNNRGEEKGKGI